MHKARSLLVAVVMVISAAALLPISASAAGPFTDVVFHIRPSFSGLNCPPFTCGTWDETVAGEIVDSGSYVREFAQTAPPNRPFGETGPYREVFLLTSVSGAGTLTISRRRTGRRLMTATVTATPIHCVQRSEESKT